MYPTRAARVLVKGAAARCCCRVQLLEWRVRSGRWCRCRVLLQGAAVKVVCALELACWCHCRMLLQGSQNTSSDLANVPRFRIGKFEAGMIRGMIRKPFFFGFRKFCCFISQRQPTTIATLQWLDLPDDPGPDLNTLNMKSMKI